jgi:hypothetical protein
MKRTTAEVWQDGLLSGLVGYALISLFFAVSNLIVGLPALATMESLGAALFGGRNPGHMVAYNGVHLIVFLILGGIASMLFRKIEVHPAFWYVLFFVAIAGFIFSYVLMMIVAGRIAGLDAYSVAVGNLIAAGGMAFFLFWRHPGMVRAVRKYSAGE